MKPSAIYTFFLLAITFLPVVAKGQSGEITDPAPKIVINADGHTGKIYTIRFTPDSEKIISVSEDKAIRIWDAKTGELLNKLQTEIGNGPEGMLYAAAISPDGKYLAVSGYPVTHYQKNYIIIIDLEKGIQVGVARGHENVINDLEFIMSGQYLASAGDDGKVILWKFLGQDNITEAAQIEVNTRVKSISYNQVLGTLALATEDRAVKVYSLQGLDKGAQKFQSKDFRKHKSNINKVCYSPDGQYLASSSEDLELIVWKSDGSIAKEWPKLEATINAIAFSNDSRLLVTMDNLGKGVSYSVPAFSMISEFLGHDNTVFSAEFSPASGTGNYLVASAGGNDNVIFIWNPINGQAVQRIKGKGTVIWELGFGSGLEFFASRSSTKGNFNFSFDLSKFQYKTDLSQPDLIKPNKPHRLSDPYTMVLPKGRAVRSDPFVDGRILDHVVNRSGQIVVGSDFSLKMYSDEGILIKEFLGHTGGVRTLALSKDEKYLISGSEDQTIKVWDMEAKGNIPSMREVFSDPDWQDFFTNLPFDSLTYQTDLEAWVTFVEILKANKERMYRDFERVMSTLGTEVKPLVNLFFSEDGEWVCWTNQGYFTSSSGGGSYFGWHVNKGLESLAEFYTAEQYFDLLYAPKIVQRLVTERRDINLILKDEGEKPIDFVKLARPSSGFFDNSSLLIGESKELEYRDRSYYTKNKTLQLTVDIIDEGGGVKEINIYQNNKLVVIDKNLPKSKEGDKYTRWYTLDLLPEMNDFKLVVFNHQNIESRPDHLKVKYDGEVFASSDLYIFSVGINEYRNPGYNLNYARSDASSFTNKVLENSKKLYRNVRKFELYDKEGTRKNFEDIFESIIAQAKQEDVFIFYYAGHGTIAEDQDNEYYLVPTDVTQIYGDSDQLQKKAIAATDLKNFLSRVKAQKQMILLDACHSGGATKAFQYRAAASEEKAIVQLARASGVVMIASSGAEQFATEFEVLQHGVFTYALIEALDGKADNGDGKVTVNEIKSYMEDRVPELSEKYGDRIQFPTGFITGNDFPVSLIDVD